MTNGGWVNYIDFCDTRDGHVPTRYWKELLCQENVSRLSTICHIIVTNGTWLLTMDMIRRFRCKIIVANGMIQYWYWSLLWFQAIHQNGFTAQLDCDAIESRKLQSFPHKLTWWRKRCGCDYRFATNDHPGNQSVLSVRPKKLSFGTCINMKSKPGKASNKLSFIIEENDHCGAQLSWRQQQWKKQYDTKISHVWCGCLPIQSSLFPT